MISLEQKLLTFLARMSERIGSHNQQLSHGLSEVHKEAHNLFESDAALERKYDLVRRIRGYGGDIESFLYPVALPDKFHTQLSLLTDPLLRNYWKGMGREWHAPSMYSALDSRTQVNLIPGGVKYYDHDDAPVSVSQSESEKVWQVEREWAADITNMPTYIIQSGDECMVGVRHEVLRVRGKKSFFRRLFGREST